MMEIAILLPAMVSAGFGFAVAWAVRWVAERPSLEWRGYPNDDPTVLAYGRLTIRNRAPRALHIISIELLDDAITFEFIHGYSGFVDDLRLHSSRGREHPVDVTLDPHSGSNSNSYDQDVRLRLPGRAGPETSHP